MASEFYRRLDEAVSKTRTARIFRDRPANLHDYQGCVNDQKLRKSKAAIPVQPALIPFNLEKALSGAALITRDGRPVTSFRRIKNPTQIRYPFEAHVGSGFFCFTEQGTYWILRPDPLDLFISEDAQ
jgi:hypothetical protein